MLREESCSLASRCLRLAGAFFVSSTLLLLAGCAHHPHQEEQVAEPVESEQPHLDYAQRYHYPLLSSGTQFAALPPAVQRTVRAEVGSMEISDVRKGANGSNLVYVIYFVKKHIMPPLYIAADGTVLTPDLKVLIPAPHETAADIGTSLTLNDLPPKVVTTIQHRVPDAEVGAIGKETHGDSVIYVIFFKGDRHPPIYVASDGAFIKEGQSVFTAPAPQ